MRIARWAVLVAAALMLGGCSAQAGDGSPVPPQAQGVAALDFCSLVNQESLRAKGVNPGTRTYSFDYCRLPLGLRAERVPDTAGPVAQIAGRSTAFKGTTPHSPLCTARTTHGPAPAARNGELEAVVLTVSGPRDEDWCQLATVVAQDAWPKIPPR